MEADSSQEKQEAFWFRPDLDHGMQGRHMAQPDQLKAEAGSRPSLSVAKSFSKSPSLQERLQQAVARKTGPFLPLVEGKAENSPPVDLSKRLEAALSSKRLGEADGFGRGLSFCRDWGKEGLESLGQEKDLPRPELLNGVHASNGVLQDSALKQTSAPLATSNRGPAVNEIRASSLMNNGFSHATSLVGSNRRTQPPDNSYEQRSRELKDEIERNQELIRRSFDHGPAVDQGDGVRPSSTQQSWSPDVGLSGGSEDLPIGDWQPSNAEETWKESGAGLGPDLNRSAEQSAEDGEWHDFFGLDAQGAGSSPLENDNFSQDAAALRFSSPFETAFNPEEAQTMKPERHIPNPDRQTLKPETTNRHQSQVVDLSSDSEGEGEPLVSTRGPQGGFHWGGQKRQLPDWAGPDKGPSKRRPFARPGTFQQFSQGPVNPHPPSIFDSDKAKFFQLDGGVQSQGRLLPDWHQKRGTGVNIPPPPSEWPVAKPGSLEALRGPQGGGNRGVFSRSQSEVDKEAAKALAGPLREAALAHLGQQASLQSQYQQQAVEHQRQQQAHFQRRILPPTMHTHTLAAGPSVPRDNDVALRGVLEGMAVDGPTEECTPPEGSMMVPLLKHQRLALSWMKKRESGTISNQPVGGVLADDQGLGKTITTLALIISNKAPPRPGFKEAPPPGRDSPAPTVNLDDYKEVFVTSAKAGNPSQGGGDSDEDELVEIPPEKVQLRLEYRPGGSRESSQQRGGDVGRDVSEEPGEGIEFGSEGFLDSEGDYARGPEEKPTISAKDEVPTGGFLQDVPWGGLSAANSQENLGGGVELGGLRLENGVLLAESQPSQKGAEDTPLVGLKRKRGAPKKEKGAKLEVQESSSGGVPRDPLSRRGRPPAGTLIVCPTSVLRQWAGEVRDKVAPGEQLRLLIYHGGGRTRDPHELAQYDIVLTTYAIVSMEVPKQPLPESEGGGSNGFDKPKEKPPQSKAKKKSKPLGEDEGLLPPGSGPLARVTWFRVVLDEAQSIKNARTQAARAAWSLRAKRRWCLSGTPIQNSIDDLYSYFRFLRFNPYDVFKSFRSLIREPIARNPAVGYRRLQVILSMIMMRRTKQTVIEGRPIIDLPPRLVELSQADFSPEERGFYDTLERESRQKFNAFRSAGTLHKNYVNILWMLLRLRQACNHWSLVKGLEGGDHHGSKEAEAVASKLRPELRASLLAEVEGLQSPCPLCHDAPEEAVVSKCCHVFCRQCIAEQVNNSDNLDAYACPVCKSAITAKDVFSPATLRKVESGHVDPRDAAATSSTDGSGRAPAVRSSSKINNMVRILLELPKRVVIVSTQTGHIVGDHKEGDSVAGSPESGVCVVDTTEKAIIFSQWTSMLDLLEGPLQHAGFHYRRLDGTMTVQARDRAISDFTKRPEVTVMIMSLKAASLGLNLVAASHVLLLDVWWNPTTEDQAIDRAHRIGQTRTVHVSRLAVRGTVEDRILALQDKKRRIVASAFGEQEGGGTARLSAEDLAFLFRST